MFLRVIRHGITPDATQELTPNQFKNHSIVNLPLWLIEETANNKSNSMDSFNRSLAEITRVRKASIIMLRNAKAYNLILLNIKLYVS